MFLESLLVTSLLLGGKSGGDWTRFGFDAARHNAGPAATGITAANVGSLVRQRVELGGTADSSPIYLRGVSVRGASHDVFMVTTSYGRTIAVDASSGTILWTFTPEGYSSWAGSYRITNATPVADPSRRYVYAASPGGRIHKLAVASGAEVRSGSWPATITRDPTHEKSGVALNYAHGLVLAATGGSLGDAPPYRGNVAAIDPRTGRLRHVWNALCSNRHALIVPRTCAASDAAIWARAGVVVVPGSGNLLVATGNGPFDGRTNWGDSDAGTSPVLAGGLLYVYDPNGRLDVYRPATGALITRLPAGSGHWNSPIVTDGRIALPEGDANDHRQSGVLNIYRLR